MSLRRAFLLSLLYANAKAKGAAIRLTRWTGKSREPVHPKHLLPDTEDSYWYLAHVNAGDRLLDIGCGHAMHLTRAARRSAELSVGVDQDHAALSAGRRLCRAQGLATVRLVCTDAEAGLPFKSSRVDTVLCFDLLEHVTRRDALLGEIRRVLRPGGRLLLAVPNRETAWKRQLRRAGLCSFSDPDHKIEYSLPELAGELRRNGFCITSLSPSVYDLPLVGFVDLAGSLSLTLYRWLLDWRRRLAVRYPEEQAGWYAVCVIQ